MSRHKIAADDAKYDVYVGFDNPLETFHAQVFDKTQDEDNETVLWAGAEPNDKILTVDDLQTRLNTFATIPQVVRTKLQREYDDRSQPPMLQRAMRALFEDTDDPKIV